MKALFLSKLRVLEGIPILIVLSCAFLTLPNVVLGHAAGAPAKTCESMMPSHGGVAAQTSLIPYDLKVSKNRVAPGEVIEFTIESKVSAGAPDFRGFIVVGRKFEGFNRDTTPYGKFVGDVSDGGQVAKFLTCLNLGNSSATQISGADRDKVVLKWEVPVAEGDYALVATVVQSKDVFWTLCPTERIVVGDGEAGNPQTSTSSTVPPVDDDIAAKYQGCGVSKGCFGIPSGCIATKSCSMFTTYQMKADKSGVNFEVVGDVSSLNSGKAYVALGLSKDGSMGSDSVIACRRQEDTVLLNEYYNRPSKDNGNFGVLQRGENGIISNADNRFINGFLCCNFTVKSSYSVENVAEGVSAKFDLINQPIYFLLAKGSDADETELPEHLHTANDRTAARSPIKLGDPIEGPGGSTQTYPTPPTPPEGGDVSFFYSGCGKTKGCFGLPSGCVSSESCALFVTYQVSGDKQEVNFQIAGKLLSASDLYPYVAFGLSSDNKMSNDQVFACRQDDRAVVVTEYYNLPNAYSSGNAAVKRDVPIISNTVGRSEDGFLTCSFTTPSRYIVKELGDASYDLSTESYYLLLARGKESAESYLGKHPDGSTFGPSARTTKLTDTSILTGKSTVLIQLHGAFMILAWLLCASSGMFTARYYKQTHTTKQPFGIALWFHIHRVCMVLTVLFTVAAFVIIFVEINGYTSSQGGSAEKSHPIIGIIVTGLAVLQVCLAVFRPHPGDKLRPLFNWVHWTVGNSAHILGIACIYLANDLSKSSLQGQTRYWGVLTGFICYHVALHVSLTIHTLHVDKKMRIQEPRRAISMGPMAPSGIGGEVPGTSLRTIILVAYLLGAAATATCLIYFVVDALND